MILPQSEYEITCIVWKLSFFYMSNDNYLRPDDVVSTLTVALHIENFMSQGKDSPYDIL